MSANCGRETTVRGNIDETLVSCVDVDKSCKDSVVPCKIATDHS